MTDVIDFYHQLNREWKSEIKKIQNSLESLANYNEEVTRDTAFRKRRRREYGNCTTIRKSEEFLRVDWTEPKAQGVLNRTWYHLTVRERDSAQGWLASQLKDLGSRSRSRRSLDVRHFVPVQPAEPIRWVELDLVNLSIRDEVIQNTTRDNLLSKSPTPSASSLSANYETFHQLMRFFQFNYAWAKRIYK
ncbi:Dihydropyrimidine dehydrogenase [Trichinella spiralis]|uniref:Dihydropyrimidine dehydrogenase n=1 Tax=Trichinella spiralis TaxID=6334 RepID=A0ABR3KU20_TRISP